MNVHLKVNADSIIALGDGQFQHLNDQKSIISRGLLHFFKKQKHLSFPSLSPLSSSWLNPELLHSHRGDGLELAKDLVRVDRWLEEEGRGSENQTT